MYPLENGSPVKNNAAPVLSPEGALAALSGLLLTASFPKNGWSVVAWFALVPLCWALRQQTASTAFKLGFIAGAVHFGTLLYWVTGVMETYGGLPVPVSWGVLCLLAGYLALYVGAFSWGLRLFRSHAAALVWAAPLLWVSLEFIRGFFLSGFPWENLGYSQFHWLQLIQVSDMFGVYGVSALILAVNVLFFELLHRVRAKKALPWIPLLFIAGLLGGTFGYGVWRINAVDAAAATAPQRVIAVAQGNINQAQKWDLAFQEETLQRYENLTRATLGDRPDLIIWPETALPFYFLDDPVPTSRVLRLISEAGTYFVLGAPSFEEQENRGRYFNSAYLVGPGGEILGRYDKVHLVPFGEYVPLKRFLPFLGKVVQAVGDFVPGEEGRVLSWKGQKLGVLICFEIIFPDLARAMALSGAGLLINVTNDAWFGRSSAAYQHLSMAVFRAVENHRALARAANTGISAFVDPAGRLWDETPLFEEAIRTRSLPVMSPVSFYARYGDLFAGLCTALSVGLLAGILWLRRNQKSRREENPTKKRPEPSKKGLDKKRSNHLGHDPSVRNNP